MKKAMSDYIRQNENLRKFLLSQDGGIMKYWAEHPDKDFDTDLFDGYENQIVKAFVHANKLNRAVRSLSADELREKSLDWYHHSKGSELKFYIGMKPILNAIDREVSEQALNYIEIYMSDAYKESRRRKYKNGIPPQDFYCEVLANYGSFGLSLDCLERVLQESRAKAVNISVKHFFLSKVARRANSLEWEEEYNLQVEFDCRMFKETFFIDGAYKKLRQAIKEIMDNNTPNISAKERREECCKIVKDEMRKVNHFTRWVNNESYPLEESENGEFVPLITSEERHWLRNIMYESSPCAKGKQHLTTMDSYFCFFISVLEKIGQFWAAQLLVHRIDMRELEKETGVVLSRLPDYMYYIDSTPEDRRGACCVYDSAAAKKLLSKVIRKINLREKVLTWEDEKQCFKAAVLHVFELKKNEGDFLFEKSVQWIAVYRFAVDSGIMYDMDDPNEPEDKSTPQYAVFEKFTSELQFDIEPTIRIPFKKDYIKDLNKSNYIRYNKHHPWSMEGLSDPRSDALYKELEVVYLVLAKTYENLVHQAERIVG